MKRGDPLGFINIHSVAKYQKTRRGDSFETLKNFRKKFRTVPKKIERGDPLVSSGFVGYVKKVKNERGTFCTKFPLAWLGLSNLISFCKKWYIRDELCGLTKKKEKKNKTGTSKVGAISKAQKAQSFLNMPKMYSLKALKTLSRHPKCAFHARYDWKITFPDWKQKILKIFLKKHLLNFFEKNFENVA